jgi:hypothetical protein
MTRHTYAITHEQAQALKLGERARVKVADATVYGTRDGRAITGGEQPTHIAVRSKRTGRTIKRVPCENRTPDEIRSAIRRAVREEGARL